MFIRSGFAETWTTLTEEKRENVMKDNKSHVGLENTVSMLAFLWDNRFAAVAGDFSSFEVWPPRERQPSDPELMPKFLHESVLAGFGIPIVEMFDLEELAEHCRDIQRYTFFLTSEQHVSGGVAR